MKIALIEIYPLKKINTRKMIDAHLRNSITLSEYLKCDLLLIESDFIAALDKKYDILILSYGSAYAPFNLIERILYQNNFIMQVLMYLCVSISILHINS